MRMGWVTRAVTRVRIYSKALRREERRKAGGRGGRVPVKRQLPAGRLNAKLEALLLGRGELQAGLGANRIAKARGEIDRMRTVSRGCLLLSHRQSPVGQEGGGGKGAHRGQSRALPAHARVGARRSPKGGLLGARNGANHLPVCARADAF